MKGFNLLIFSVCSGWVVFVVLNSYYNNVKNRD